MYKTLVILNPASRRGTAARTWEKVEIELRAAGVEFDLKRTHQSLHAVQLAWEACDQGYERIIAVGGDGLVHEILNGLMRANGESVTIPIGIIPVGNGNDFLKMAPPICKIGENHDDWHAAVRRIAQGKPTLFDVGKMTGDPSTPGRPNPVYFHNAADLGIAAMVAKDTWVTRRYLSGTAMYLASVFRTLARIHLPYLMIELDNGARIEQTSTMTSIANGRCVGGGFWVAPGAQADDGQFEVMVAKGLNRRQILGLIPRVMKGTHLTHPAVRLEHAARIVIDSRDPLIVESDGELPFLDARHLEIEILPRRLQIIV